MMVPMKWLVAIGLVAAAGSTTLFAVRSQQQQGPPPTATAVREAAAAGRSADAWAMLNRMPIEMPTVELAVELALAPKSQSALAGHLPFLADRTARLSIESKALDRQLTACAIVVRMTSDAACTEQLASTTRGSGGTTLDRVRLWVTRRLFGEQPEALPPGWEQDVLGSSALEVATWTELPAASRVRLLEPMVTSPDPGRAIAALATLQTIPGPEAEALWRRLAAGGGPTYPGAKTQITVGLARHGDPESTSSLAPYLNRMSASDRLVLAQGRAERRDATAVSELVGFVNTGAEHDAVRAAEALASIGGAKAIDGRVATWVGNGSIALRERWLAVAARLNLGASPSVVRLLTSDDEAVRLAAAVAVATAVRQAGR